MTTARLSSKSQIVVPAEVRRRLHLRPGDSVEIAVEDDVATLRKTAGSHTDELARCASKTWAGYAAELARERARWDD